MPNPQITSAKNIYWWLWLSPLVVFWAGAIVTGFASVFQPRSADTPLVNAMAAIARAMPHLWLLIPAIVAQSEFVRWHARQAILLVIPQTMIGLVSALAPGLGLAISAAVGCLPAVIWFIGTLWGHRQARRGDCALMRWAGRGASLPLPLEIESAVQPAAANRADALVAIIRRSRDETQRRAAVDELRKLGLVEEF